MSYANYISIKLGGGERKNGRELSKLWWKVSTHRYKKLPNPKNEQHEENYTKVHSNEAPKINKEKTVNRQRGEQRHIMLEEIE